MTRYRYRSIWIADVPLDTTDTRLDPLLEFLHTTRSDRLYVIGNLIDGGKLCHKWFWDERHVTLVEKFLHRQRKHPVVTYVTGTHDVFRRPPLDRKAGVVRVTRDVIHQAADGRRYLVVTGTENNATLRSAEIKGADGVICGDWVGSCLALVEDQTGCFSLIHFGETVSQVSNTCTTQHQAEVYGSPA